MRYTILALTLLLTSFAFAGDPRANCSLTKASILSVTSSGVAQVSNVGLIDLTRSFPGRPFPTQPGTSKSLPKVVSTAYEIKSNGDKEQVP